MKFTPIQRHLSIRKVRKIITYRLQHESNEIFDGYIEFDESYFGGARKGKRSRGAAGKVTVFCILKRQGKVYTVVVPDNTKANTLMPIISSKIKHDSVFYTDSWRSHNALNVSRFHHERINHSTDFSQGKNHINGIENFWMVERFFASMKNKRRLLS